MRSTPDTRLLRMARPLRPYSKTLDGKLFSLPGKLGRGLTSTSQVAASSKHSSGDRGSCHLKPACRRHFCETSALFLPKPQMCNSAFRELEVKTLSNCGAPP